MKNKLLKSFRIGNTYAVAFSFIILLCTSCGSHDEKPDYVLSEEKMVDILVDVHVAEAILTRARSAGTDVKYISDDYYQKIFEKHQIDKATYDTSFAYYQDHLKQFDKIYEQTITQLNKMQREREDQKREKGKEEMENLKQSKAERLKEK